MRRSLLRNVLAALAILAMCLPDSLLACAACYGRSDSNLARGMNWGIFSLLVVVVTVLGGIASFFVYIAKRSDAGAGTSPEAGADSNPKVS
jgi:hypothetical protein